MLSEKQLKVLAFGYSDYDYLICDGAIRSGKTSVMFVAFIDWAMRMFSGRDFIVMGNTVGTVKRNVIRPYMAMSYAIEKYALSLNNGDNIFTVKRGATTNTFYIFGADNERAQDRIQGATMAGLFVDEVALCQESAFNQALARLSFGESKAFFNCNPNSPSHWFYRKWILRAEELNALRITFYLQDNPGLSERVIQRFERQYAGVFYQRYVLGQWVIAEGLVYPFEREKILASEEDLSRTGGSWYVSIDYGITNPFAACLWHVFGDVAIMTDLYYFSSAEEGRRLTDEEHYERVCELAEGHEIEEVIVDPSAASFLELIDRRGLFFRRKAKNDVMPGIQLVSSLFEQGAIKVARNCQAFWVELGLYSWDKNKQGDAVVKANDHVMDAVRYMASTVLKYELNVMVD